MKKNLNLPKKKTGRLRNLFLTVCLLASTAASAQEKTVTGTVTDALGDPLSAPFLIITFSWSLTMPPTSSAPISI